MTIGAGLLAPPPRYDRLVRSGLHLDTGVPTHLLGDHDILHHQLSCGAQAQCLWRALGWVYAAQHGQHKAGGLPAAIVGLQGDSSSAEHGRQAQGLTKAEQGGQVVVSCVQGSLVGSRAVCH